MKNHIIQMPILIFALMAMVVSCKKDDNSNLDDNSNVPTSTIIVSGSWMMSYYHDNNDDHTGNFNGYSFVFNSDGSMTATNVADTTSGTWSNDDNHNEFHISLGNTDPLKDLSKGWLISSKTGTELILQDNSLAHIEELHFTRI